MTVIGFLEEEIRQVLEVTALVLKLGNVVLMDEFQANGIPASGIRDGKGLCYLTLETPARIAVEPLALLSDFFPFRVLDSQTDLVRSNKENGTAFEVG